MNDLFSQMAFNFGDEPTPSPSALVEENGYVVGQENGYSGVRVRIKSLKNPKKDRTVPDSSHETKEGSLTAEKPPAALPKEAAPRVVELTLFDFPVPEAVIPVEEGLDVEEAAGPTEEILSVEENGGPMGEILDAEEDLIVVEQNFGAAEEVLVPVSETAVATAEPAIFDDPDFPTQEMEAGWAESPAPIIDLAIPVTESPATLTEPLAPSAAIFSSGQEQVEEPAEEGTQAPMPERTQEPMQLPMPAEEPIQEPVAELVQGPTQIPETAKEPTRKPMQPQEPMPAQEPAPAPIAGNIPNTPVKSKRGRKSLKQITAEADLIEIPADDVLFSKQYYTMRAVAEMFRVNQSLLRFWETEFDILQPRKNKKGDRYFRPVDIKNLHLIYHLLRQRKYTIEGAKEFLKTNQQAEERFEAIQGLQQLKTFLLEWKTQL